VNRVVLILASSLLSLVAAARQAPYRPPAPLVLVAPPEAGVSVAVYDAGRDLSFARLFDGPGAARLARYSIVLTNESRHIVGVAVRWIATDHNGQSRTTTWSFDSFSIVQLLKFPVQSLCRPCA